MDKETALFLLGLGASVPLTIITNLGLRRVEKWRAKRSSRRSRERIKQLTTAAGDVLELAKDRHSLTQYMLARLFDVIGAISIGVLFAAIIGLLSGFLISAVAGIITSIVILSICTKALQVYRQATHLDEFLAHTNAELSQLLSQVGESSAGSDAADSKSELFADVDEEVEPGDSGAGDDGGAQGD
ncbi:MAG: hypothetical protein FWG16_03480 [Micrococcales bacterium]|nr:hypothetical protein [Micrococcales bacterium]